MANLNLNKVILGGRITHDLELKATTNGMKVLAFSIAVNRKNKSTDFINVKAFGSVAEFISKYFKKGSSICTVGSIQVGSWKDADGNKKTAVDVIIDEALFVDSKSEVASFDDNAFANVTPKFEEIVGDDDLPF